MNFYVWCSIPFYVLTLLNLWGGTIALRKDDDKETSSRAVEFIGNFLVGWVLMGIGLWGGK